MPENGKLQIKRLFFHVKPVSMLILLKDGNEWSASKIAKESGSTYVHTHNAAKILESSGLITTRQSGKLRMIKITDKGQAIAQSLDDASRKIDSAVEELKIKEKAKEEAKDKDKDKEKEANSSSPTQPSA